MATKTPDWERIEILYRAGTVSVRELANQQGVSHTAIAKRAKRDDWTRDINAQIRAKADAKVSRAAVASAVSTETKITEKLVIEVESEVQARIRLAHQASVSKLCKIKDKLLAHIEKAVDALANVDDAVRKTLGRSAVIDDLKKLAEIDEKIRKGEREAYGIDLTQPTPEDDLASLLANICKKSAFPVAPC